MKNYLKKHWLKAIGVIIGGVAGYLYYFYIGCASGSCPLTTNPWITTLYGAFAGYVVFDIFTDKKNKKETLENK